MPDFSILLPTAEAKQPGGNPFAPDMFDYRSSNTFNYFSELNPERRLLINRLRETVEAGEGLETIFGVKGEHLDEVAKINLEVMDSPLMAAMDRYSPGVMYRSMDFAGLPTGAQRRLLEHGIVFSGLFGLLRPDDLIPDYRLRMDAELPGIGKVTRFWRPHLSPVLNRTLKGRFVWNLLTAACLDAWEDDHSYQRMVQVKFLRAEGGERKPVTHNVKVLRGELVNFIVREAAENVEALHMWENSHGFVVDESASEWDDETKSGTIVMVAGERQGAAT